MNKFVKAWSDIVHVGMTHSNQIMMYIKITLSGEIKALLGLSLLTIGVSVRCLARAILLTFIAKVVPSFLHQSWCPLPRNHIELVHIFLWFSPIQFLICHLKVVGGNIRENTYLLSPLPQKFLLKGGEAGSLLGRGMGPTTCHQQAIHYIFSCPT